jgi:hypothetical protein
MDNELITKLASNSLTNADRDKMLLYIVNKLDAQDDTNKEVKRRLDNMSRFKRDVEEEYPILPPEADELSKEVRKKGVEILGGRNSNAYADASLRKSVYRDIYYEIKREYGLIDEKGCQLSYKKLKRKHFKGALAVIADYVPPIGLQNEITSLNELDEDE